MIVYVLFALVFGWLAVSTYLVLKTRSHYNRLVVRTGADSLEKALNALIKDGKELESQVAKHGEKIKDLQKQGVAHLQKIGFVRFNPFERVGGDQSFILALIDEQDSGILLNFLYTREGIRVYAKRVHEGKSDEYQLSKEEAEAIKKAK